MSLGRLGRERRKGAVCVTGKTSKGKEGRGVVSVTGKTRKGKEDRKGVVCVTGQTGKERRMTARRYKSFPLRRKDNNEERKQHSC